MPDTTDSKAPEEAQERPQARIDKTQQRKLERQRKAQRVIARYLERGNRLPNPLPEDFQPATFVQKLTSQLRYSIVITKATPNFTLADDKQPIASDLRYLAVFHRFIAKTCQIPLINSKRRDERIIHKSKMSRKPGEKEVELVPQEFKIIVLAANVNRVQDLEASCDQLAVCSILSQHYTLDQHVRMISSGAYKDCQVAICSPQRILTLMEKNAIVQDKVEKIVLDWTYIDQKNRCMMEYDDMRSQAVRIVARCGNAEIVIL